MMLWLRRTLVHSYHRRATQVVNRKSPVQ